MFDKKVSIIIPKTDNTGKTHSEVLPEVSKRLSLRFGGCTLHDVTGLWYDDRGQPIEDKSTLVYSYFDSQEVSVLDAQDAVLAIAKDVKVNLAQDAVLFAIEDARAVLV